jgi:hypothetical protein
MYGVINEEYPSLDTYLCYGCGFHADCILMEQKDLYQQYQWLFSHSKGILVPKKVPSPTRNQHDYKHEDDSTEPKLILSGTATFFSGAIFSQLFAQQQAGNSSNLPNAAATL